MQITTLISAAAITLAATIGSVSAAEQFTTLGGISAVPMSSSELGAVRGTHKHVTINGVVRTITFVAAGFGIAGPGPGGARNAGEPGDISFVGGHLQNAETFGNGTIDVCNFGAGC